MRPPPARPTAAQARLGAVNAAAQYKLPIWRTCQACHLTFSVAVLQDVPPTVSVKHCPVCGSTRLEIHLS